MVAITGPSSRMMKTTIGDLPEVVLVEILGRLPCYKFIARCKCVSKHWCTFMSDPCFIRRFLCFQSYGKQTFMTRTLINCQGEEFLARMSSSFKALTPLFKRLVNLHHLKEEPVVVGSYNDLVLCCASRYYQRDYFICNPYTFECATLPPPPLVTEVTGVGIFCDLPYYKCKKNDLGGHDIQLNADYRCRVIRIIFQRVSEMMHMLPSCEFKVQIFSSETGVWRESIVSSPSRFNSYEVNHRFSFANNGVLYWLSDSGDFLIGLDPFMMDNRSTSASTITSSTVEDSDYHCEFLFTNIDWCYRSLPKFLGLHKGCLQIGDYSYGTHAVNAWEFHEEFHIGSGKLLLEQNKRVYSLDLDTILDDNSFVDVVGFDPSNEGEGILYLLVLKDVDIDTHGDIFMCNICTGKCLKIFENHSSGHDFFRVAVPWWPTPVPSLPEREANPLVLPRLDDIWCETKRIDLR